MKTVFAILLIAILPAALVAFNYVVEHKLPNDMAKYSATDALVLVMCTIGTIEAGFLFIIGLYLIIGW